MAWACVVAFGSVSLFFTNDVIHDGSSRINLEDYRNILSACVQRNAS